MERQFGTPISGNARPRSQLSRDERIFILGLLAAGTPKSKVVKLSGRSLNSIKRVQRALIHEDRIDPKPRLGRPKKISRRDQRHLLRLARIHPKWTYKQLIGHTGIPVHRCTIQRMLKKHGIKKWVARKRPQLTPEHAKQRLQFAREHADWVEEWRHIIFSDECSLERGSGKDRVWCWRTPQQKWDTEMLDTRPPKHEIRQMFWGAFWYYGRSELYNMERDEYAPKRGYSATSMLKLLEEAIPTIYEPPLVFMQDNAPIHRAAKVLKYLEDNAIPIFKWPPYSPDLNPIENLWWILKKKVLELHPELEHQGASEEAYDNLIRASKEAWDAIGVQTLEKLIESMPKRMQTVIKAKGWQTRW